MDGFQVITDTELLQGAAKNVKASAEELSAIATKYLNDVQAMRSSGAWTGRAADAYAEKNVEFKKKVDEIIAPILRLADSMDKTALDFNDAEAKNKARIQGLI